MKNREFGILLEGARTLNLHIQRIIDNEKRWVAYIGLLKSWGERISLLSKEDLDKRIPHHILDSLLLSKFIPEGTELMDIGTGAGFPGIPLAIYRDDLFVYLVESKLKKGTFLRAVKYHLNLDNVHVYVSRWEELCDIKVDIIVTRATGFSEDELDEMRRLLKEGGKIFRYSTRPSNRAISHRVKNPLREKDFYILEYC